VISRCLAVLNKMFEKYLKIFLSHPPLLVTSSNASRWTTGNKMLQIPDSRKDKHQRYSVAKCIYSTAYGDQLSPLSTCHGTHLLSAPSLFSISKESSDSSLVDSTVLVSVDSSGTLVVSLECGMLESMLSAVSSISVSLVYYLHLMQTLY